MMADKGCSDLSIGDSGTTYGTFFFLSRPRYKTDEYDGGKKKLAKILTLWGKG
jgi:hypothetical protein